MNLQPLDNANILQLSGELESYADWLIAMKFAEDIFGPGVVHKVEVETESQYNDEGGTSEYISFVSFYDAEGNYLDSDRHDLTTEFWRKQGDGIDDPDYRDDIIYDARYDLPRETAVYVAGQPPRLSFTDIHGVPNHG